jgi:hypothetical protein
MNGFANGANGIGLWIFVLGTILAVWSGCRYIARYRHLIFSPAD